MPDITEKASVTNLLCEETVAQALERTEKQIQSLKSSNVNVRNRWHTHIRRLVISTILLELTYAFVYYLIFFGREPDVPMTKDGNILSRNEIRGQVLLWKVIYASPLFVIIFAGIILRRLINWWFGSSIANYEKRVANLLKEQDTQLSEFAKSTKYYETQELINKYSKKAVKSPAKPNTKSTNEISLTKEVQQLKSNTQRLNEENFRLKQYIQQLLAAQNGKELPALTQEKKEEGLALVEVKKEQEKEEKRGEKEDKPQPLAIKAETPEQSPGKKKQKRRYVMAVPADIIAGRNRPQLSSASEENEGWFDRLCNYLVGPEYSEKPKESSVLQNAAPLEERMAAIIEANQSRDDHDDGADETKDKTVEEKKNE
ncbi:Nucleosomal binding protein 1 [Planoprotostelium fungivorum]|uniref:Nucleosomal binding protein 1 n=1 Tax=Planoprotostelium fungivorum TaxID=1890364 RepID=A0A2P6NVZ2_9EUKA|nr:Nucleosomal binding protein 1 [Planoprotostelium fungivorum]